MLSTLTLVAGACLGLVHAGLASNRSDQESLIPVHDLQFFYSESNKITGQFYLSGTHHYKDPWPNGVPQLYINTEFLDQIFQPVKGWRPTGKILPPRDGQDYVHTADGTMIPFEISTTAKKCWLAVQLRGRSPVADEDEISFVAANSPPRPQAKANAIVPISLVTRNSELTLFDPTPIYTFQEDKTIDLIVTARLTVHTTSPRLGSSWKDFPEYFPIEVSKHYTGTDKRRHSVDFTPVHAAHYLIAAYSDSTYAGGWTNREWSGVIRPPN